MSPGYNAIIIHSLGYVNIWDHFLWVADGQFNIYINDDV